MVRNHNKNFPMNGILTLLVFLCPLACSPGSGSIGGKITTRTIGGGPIPDDSDVKSEKTAKSSSNPKDAEKELGGEDSQAPAPSADETLPNPEEVSIPSEITGTFLFCYRDKIEGAKATVYCATEDEDTKQIFEPSERFASYAFSTNEVDGLTIKKKDLPIVHRYNVEFTVTASSADALIANQGAVKYLFQAKDFDDRVVNLNARVTNNSRPQIWVQSLKPQNNMGFRCLDRYRMQAAQPYQVVTTPCDANSSAQSWYITADKKIAYITGECLAFDPYDGLTIVKSCDSAESPKFDFNGEEIRIQGSTNCLGLKNADNSGVDYSAAVACRSSDNQQHWSISAEAKAGVN